MTDIIVVYSDKSHLNRIGDTSKYTPIFHFVDSLATKSKKEAWRVKSYYGAKLDPFAVILDNENQLKLFTQRQKMLLILLLNT